MRAPDHRVPFQPRRVQEKAFGLDDRPHFLSPSLLNVALKDPRINIDLVAHDGMPQEREVGADLMRAARSRHHLQKGIFFSANEDI